MTIWLQWRKYVKNRGGGFITVENDADKLADPSLNDAWAWDWVLHARRRIDYCMTETDTVGGIDFEIIHTPGHSAGGICIKAENKVFTGDTLFKMGIGRTDLLDGDINPFQFN